MRKASWCIADRWWHLAIGVILSARPSGSSRRPVLGPTWRTPELAVWSGDTVVADEDGYLYFVGRRDEMIKTSGYRVSPTEVEEVAYDSGLVRDAVALGVDDDRLGQRIVLLATAANGQLDPSALIAHMRRKLPLYMVPAVGRGARPAPEVAERQVRPGPTEV